ncbi:MULTISPECIES: multicopper oxidase family protein [Bacteria]|jgi:FtsP/CotA-like multicopper oxidase with cupredoxin domain|uniref:Copper oxidase n=5 Tax=Bacteria TaxID=2 RepID=A0A177JY48_SPHYA|nr:MULTISPECIES: copper oxidase [Sphingomonadales]MDH2170545.1 copper oxidase [Sphingobium yanoikuyae]OAH45355.1 copper oxidase [Sphingobium yanoikuyae]|tara:strand:- start:464 stop:1816 length:1353 start_codon:yes stop_codon:yes gene_type:complete
MTIHRRDILKTGAAAALGSALTARAAAQDHSMHGGMAMGPMPMPAAEPVGVAPAVPRDPRYVPVRTLNGWTLPWRLNAGVKEFHLVAEEVKHEFAPGSKATCWGYNGGTPGPTIEAVEGDRVRIFVTNRLGEHTSVHWHGLILPSGMDGVGGMTQPHIQPGETYVYEFTLRQHGTHMYHPHADEMTQMAYGMMGLFIIHPRGGEIVPVDRDYAFLLHNWALKPGTWRPDPSIMVEFDQWTFNSKMFPAIDPIVARTGERVRIRAGNLSMWNHPIHLHGVEFEVTGSDGGRWPRERWRREVTELVSVGQMRDIEFTAVAGDWAFHCHMAHHTMNAMGHGIPNQTGVDQSGVEARIRKVSPNFLPMMRYGMAEHQEHTDGGHQGPVNTTPMMGGKGQFGNMEMGGMFTVVKVRDDIARGDFTDPGWYRHPAGTVAKRVSADPDFGSPPRRQV